MYFQLILEGKEQETEEGSEKTKFKSSHFDN